MARITPDTPSDVATGGERQLFKLFKNNLPDNWLVYFNIPVRGKYSDFIIIGPDLGLLVIEVKDWTVRTINTSSKDRFLINVPGGPVYVDNPINQARKYVFTIIDEIKRKESYSLLRQKGANNNRLVFPYNFMIAFPNISEKQSIELGFGNIFDRSQLLLRADCDPGNSNVSNLLQTVIESNVRRVVNLSNDQFSSLQKAIYRRDTPNKYKSIVMQLDANQGTYAKNIGPGHRLISGVAGSGKTMICAYRANLLAALNRNWKILVLCYTKSLVHYIAKTIEQTADEYYPSKSTIEVKNFHGWCFDLIRKNGGNTSSLFKDRNRIDDRFKEQIDKLLDEGKIRTGTYDAIIIDEGQDFHSWWYLLTTKMVKPDSNNILVCFDNNQKIYPRDFSWKECGISARGRTNHLRINYRNTKEIVEFAEALCFEKSVVNKKDESIMDDIMRSEKLRNGRAPAIYRARSVKDQAEYIARTIKDLLEYDLCTADEIGCVCLKGFSLGPLLTALDKHSIPHLHITKNSRSKGSPFLHDNNVDVLTVHSAKGLEYKALFVYNAQDFSDNDCELAYVAMTRAQDLLYITHTRDTSMTNKMHTLLESAS
jgi:hypothetical protein